MALLPGNTLFSLADAKAPSGPLKCRAARPSLFRRLSDVDRAGDVHIAGHWHFLDPGVPGYGLGAQFPLRPVDEDHSRHRNHRADANGEVLHR